MLQTLFLVAKQVTIDNLISSTLYQFEVVAVAELNGDVVIGQRSPTSSIILYNITLS